MCFELSSRAKRFTMETKKLLVKEGDIAVVVCPFCRKTKNMSVSQYKDTGERELRITCNCANVLDICLEYRKHPRQETKLLGKSINLSNLMESQDIIVKNISLGGIGLSPLADHNTSKDDRLHVSFTLNNSKQTPIDANVAVRSVLTDYIGCEFNSSDHFKTALGFYLIR